MDFPMCVSIAPLPDAPAPTAEATARPGNFDALADCHVEFSPDGKTALALVSLRKRLAARTRGHLTARDHKNLARHCKQLGFNEIWTNFVLGAQ